MAETPRTTEHLNIRREGADMDGSPLVVEYFHARDCLPSFAINGKPTTGPEAADAFRRMETADRAGVHAAGQ